MRTHDLVRYYRQEGQQRKSLGGNERIGIDAALATLHSHAKSEAARLRLPVTRHVDDDGEEEYRVGNIYYYCCVMRSEKERLQTRERFVRPIAKEVPNNNLSTTLAKYFRRGSLVLFPSDSSGELRKITKVERFGDEVRLYISDIVYVSVLRNSEMQFQKQPRRHKKI